MAEEMITIPAAQYKELLADQKLLLALQAAGVDNWQGYDDALTSLSTEEEEEDAK